MASITITIPDAVLPDVLDAFAVKYGWTPQMGIAKAAFAKKINADFIKSTYQNYMADKASDAARLQAKQTVGNVDIN